MTSEEEVCGICQNGERDASVICVVEEMLDLIALEQANNFKGHYHVLHGVISPIEGVGPDELKIAELIDEGIDSMSLTPDSVIKTIFTLNEMLNK